MNNNNNSNKTLIIVALIGFAGTIGAALITKGIFDEKIEKEYTPKTEIVTNYTPNNEVEKLKHRIDNLEKLLVSQTKKQKTENQLTVVNDEVFNIDSQAANPEIKEIQILQTKKIGEWVFNLMQCSRNNNDVTCFFTVLSKHRDREFKIQGFNPYLDGSMLYDDFGNKYEGADVTLSSNDQNPQRVNKKLIADIEVRGSVLFKNIDRRAKKISLLELEVSGDDLSQKRIQFRDIKIQ